MADISARGRIPLLVGGTMLYFRALQRGLSSLPTADAQVRGRIEARAEREGWAILHAELARVDPQSAQRIHPNDPQRIQRALEVYELTGRALTEKPAIFVRMPASQVAHGQAIIRPPESERLDYEGEIAIVIGQGGRRIAEADAWSHIAGYSCYNDGSIRDWQNHTTQWTAGKNYWRTGGFGPWLVTADEIKPNQQMTLTTRLNGVELQRATTDMMIHSIPRQIAYISTFIPLLPGDVIVTGTPGGVGNKRTPQLFMKPGDTVEIEVDAVGILRNSVRDEV